uniref:Structure-specific endonuclease subunit SLX4 n=2 Tax=Sphaeramia orbicularis TaxID=375764 RepID=A0A672YD37_9TELE
MVNNPQLSDVQLQVDSGDVYFAHSFMVYARCPLLAELVHESGFGVKEEGVPAAQRVLMSDVPGQAVFALLQYLYTAHCSFPASLRPHILELASRFDLQELQQICQLRQDDTAAQGDDTEYTYHEQNVNDQTDQAFLELLRSMWNDEEQDEEGMDTDEGRDREESENQCDDPTSGDREMPEEQVNEDELMEIYEFAATQKKKEEEEDSVEEEKKNDGDLEMAEDQVFTKLTEQQPNCQSGPNSSLDRSYNRLFSDSWGIYEEEDPSTLPSTSRQSNRHTIQSQFDHKLSSEPLARTVLQSSASVIGKLSPSPPPSTPSMPVPGLSPGGEEPGAATLEVQNDCIQLRDKNLSLKTESQGPRILCIPLSPDYPQENKQPELIVLSDSSEEMEVDYAVLSSRSPSPCIKENTQNYTHIKEQVKPNEINPKSKGQGDLDSSLTGKLPVSEPGGPGSGCQSPVNCSPEVSWLIPSTPVQPGRSIRTTSSQTNSSMCRTQLFTKGDTSSNASSLSSPMSDRIQRSTSPPRVSSITGLTHASVSRLKPDRTAPSISSLDVSVSNKHSSSQKRRTDSKLDFPVFVGPSCQAKPSQLRNSSNHLSCLPSSTRDPHLHIPTYCSTPLHTELHQTPVPPPESPLAPVSTDPEKSKSAAQETEKTPTTSPEKTVLNSFHLSPLSERSSSSHRAPPGSNKSQCSPEFSCHDNTGNDGDERRDGRHEDNDGQIECEQDIETEEAAESSFQQSFMDEPPIAFNDSWGLDACVENPGCFSLKLEESRGSSRQDQSLEQRETAESSTSSLCQPVPFSRQVPSMNSRGDTTKSSLFSTRASDLPSRVEAHVGPSLTPSPPDPIAHPAPDINNSLLDSKIWDSWEEDEEEERALPLSQRINPTVQLKTPKSSHNAKHRSLEPITPMPHYSDMDTPELKNKLTRFGVRPLPKRQMILKLKEIHEYTHQLVSSDSEEEAPSMGHATQTKPPTTLKPSVCRPVSCTQIPPFKEPRAPTAASPMKHNREEEEAEPLSASQDSNTSSTAASEESERSNPELCLLSDGDSDSDGSISASQAATRLQDRLLAVRSFILSNPGLYDQILQYQPLVLSQFQQQLKDAGIRLGVAKLADYLDSQCITFTTAKPGHSAPGRRRAKKTGKGVRTAGDSRARRKRGVTAVN